MFSEEINLPDTPRGPHAAAACNQPAQKLPNAIIQSLKPNKIVIQPWKGRHHVYAEFTLPPHGYLINNQFRINLDSLGDFCGGISEVPGKPGQNSTAIARLRTRTTLWLIAQGKLDALSKPENWQLDVIPLNSLIPIDATR